MIRVVLSSYNLWGILLVLLMAQSCTSKKFLESGDSFYTGAIVKVKQSSSGTKGIVKSIAEEQLSPQANEVIVGMRPSVWMYMQADTSKKKGVGTWMKKKFGREPVLFQDRIPLKTKSVIENKLFNKGFFNAKVDFKVKSKNQEVEIVYRIYPGDRYYFDSVFVQKEKDSIYDFVLEERQNSLIKKGDPYDLEVLKEERIRVTKEVRNKGFYYLSDDYLGFKIDTTGGNKNVIAGLTIKKEVPEKLKVAYTIGEISVYPNYELSEDSIENNIVTLSIDGIDYVGALNDFDYQKLNRSIFFRTGDTYTSQNHDLTIKRLSALNVFRYVDLRFIESDTLKGVLDVVLYLTPLLPQSIRLEVGASSKSNNFVGPGVDLSYGHKNIFKGAEQFNIGVGAAFETQIGKNSQGVNSSELTVSSSLIIPRVLSPIQFSVATDKAIPKTELGVNYKLLNRTLLYRLHSSTIDFGYRWVENQKKHHKLTVIDVNYTKASEVSDTFNVFLEDNPELKSTFDQQFIFASNYNLWYYNRVPSSARSYWYFNPCVELAGNTINTLNSIVAPNKKKREIFGVAYSQFTKFDLDIRCFVPLGNEKRLVCRFNGGVGIAYGNSTSLPYLKQYFIGGSTSIRAFQARSLGPGNFQSSTKNGLLIDQSGDIKLETNIEYRTKLYRFIKGAIFIDAGNVWLMNEQESRPGGTFYFNEFLNQLAIGTGVGLRFDFTYFILRADLAFPLRKPSENGYYWSIDEFEFSNKWKEDNLVLNIAIGYPF